MKKSKIIVESGLVLKGPFIKRQTVRAIIIKNDLLMLYSSFFDDYTFPGGGSKENESHLDTLKRELKEEIGASKIELGDYFDSVVEIKYGNSGNPERVYEQISHYYFVNVLEFQESNLGLRESKQGIIFKNVDINTAITVNKRALKNKEHQKRGIQTVMFRELFILKKLKRLFN